MPLPLLPRAATARIRAAMRVHPVVVLTGARQTGKSTLLTAPPLGRRRVALSLDESRVRAALASDPDSVLAGRGPFIIDEVQREPALMLALKRVVDAMGPDRALGRFLVTGSANLLLMTRVADSLAGRAGYVTLWPMTRREQAGEGTTGRWSELFARPVERWEELAEPRPPGLPAWDALARRGGMPRAALQLRAQADRADWFDAYLDTFLDRDLRDLAQVQRLGDFRRLMAFTAMRTGQLMDQTGIGRELGLQQQTVRNWLTLLELAYQVVRVPAFARTGTGRLVKSPKLYWGDAGLGCHLAGVTTPTGFHFENVVALDLMAWRALERPRPEVMHWRSTKQQEVDFVVERGDQLLGVEVKTSKRVSMSDTDGLRAFAAQHAGRFHGGVILYDGADALRLWDNIVALPWWSVL